MRKRLIIGLVAAVIVFGGVFAAAASLIMSADQVGANNATIGVCDSDGVTTSYANAWDATDGRYEISTVTVKGVADACDGKTLKVTLTNSAGTDIGSGSLAIPTSAVVDHVVTISTPPSAKDSENIHVLIG